MIFLLSLSMVFSTYVNREDLAQLMHPHSLIFTCQVPGIAPDKKSSHIVYVNLHENKPVHNKTNKMACVPSEDSDQPGHLPPLRVFAVRMKKAWVLSYPLSTQQRLIRLGDAQADLSLCWVHMPFYWFCCALAQIRLWVFIRSTLPSASNKYTTHFFMEK